MIIDNVTSDDTIRIANKLAYVFYNEKEHWQKKSEATVINLKGDLGAGKTFFASAFIKTIAEQKNDVNNKLIVNSPTYTLVNEYNLSIPILHIDCYRLSDDLELEALAIRDYISNNKYLILVEWASQVDPIFSNPFLSIEFTEKKQKRLLQFDSNPKNNYDLHLAKLCLQNLHEF